jgi:hypothetical protein
MSREIAIGIQDFAKIRRENKFYIDKTLFIKEWWENGDDVTLINRPRRFGKTLNLNMLDYFFSVDHKDCGELFEGLNIWKEEKYRQLQGTYPVIYLSFANVKEKNFENTKKKINSIISSVYNDKRYILEKGEFSNDEKNYYSSINREMDETDATDAVHMLSKFLKRYYGKNVIIILDEYDTPMQEAYVNGYWDEASQFFRNLFNATFKTNPYMERTIITGITRISKESMFSDLNNPKVITTTSKDYATAFGFTEDEVYAAMDEFGITTKDEMKRWYDGFKFGDVTDIYNPWSVTNSLRDRQYFPYWVNTSSNALLNSLMRGGNAELKIQMEELLKGNSIKCFINEEVVYKQLETNKDAVWSLMLATGYLKAEKVELVGRLNKRLYSLTLPNMEVESMFNDMVGSWFEQDKTNYNGFIQALLMDNVKRMNTFINKFSLNTFSYFDSGNRPSEDSEPERFYHGFVLGLVVDLAERYVIKSNRESGFGRYDVMMIPKDKDEKAFIFEFKVKDADDDEQTLEDTLKNALSQIEEKKYEQEIISAGIPAQNIRKYGFVFEGKKVLIG